NRSWDSTRTSARTCRLRSPARRPRSRDGCAQSSARCSRRSRPDRGRPNPPRPTRAEPAPFRATAGRRTARVRTRARPDLDPAAGATAEAAEADNAAVSRSPLSEPIQRIAATIGHVQQYFMMAQEIRETRRDEISDFAAGDPQEMQSDAYVEALRRWTVPE